MRTLREGNDDASFCFLCRGIRSCSHLPYGIAPEEAAENGVIASFPEELITTKRNRTRSERRG